MPASAKSPNGQANSNAYLLVFDLDDESQAKAWKVAQQLAAERKLEPARIGHERITGTEPTGH